MRQWETGRERRKKHGMRSWVLRLCLLQVPGSNSNSNGNGNTMTKAERKVFWHVCLFIHQSLLSMPPTDIQQPLFYHSVVLCRSRFFCLSSLFLYHFAYVVKFSPEIIFHCAQHIRNREHSKQQQKKSMIWWQWQCRKWLFCWSFQRMRWILNEFHMWIDVTTANGY